MSNQRKDGGPAFARSAFFARGMDRVTPSQSGMMMRDWFAGQAPAGIGTWNPHNIENLNSDAARECRAVWAYRQADAMLKAREA